MDKIREILKKKIVEAVNNVANQQQPTQQKNTNVQPQNQSPQMQVIQKKFGEISSFVNNGNTVLQNATREFANGINSFTKCTSGFDERMKDTLATGLDFFVKGNEELGKLTSIFKNIQQLTGPTA